MEQGRGRKDKEKLQMKSWRETRMDAQTTELSQSLEAKQKKGPTIKRVTHLFLVFFCNVESQWELSHDESMQWLGLKVQMSLGPITSFDLTAALCCLSHTNDIASISSRLSMNSPQWDNRFSSWAAFLLKQLFWKCNHVMPRWILPQVDDGTLSRVSVFVGGWKWRVIYSEVI